ncbi:hypothetical protein Tco_0957407 [Tanacetum coccineum]
MINPNPDTGIDSILNFNTESTSLIDVPITMNVEMPLSSATTLPPPPIPLNQPLQQTAVTTPIVVPSIVDNYLASKSKDAVDMAVQLQSNKLREEAQAENDEFLNKIDSNIKAIIKDQVKGQVSKILLKIKQYVTESLGAEVLVKSTNQPQTSYAVAASR